jgi:hypothetical protein
MTEMELATQKLLEKYTAALKTIANLKSQVATLEFENSWLRLEFKGKLEESYYEPEGWDWEAEPELK